MKNLKKLINQAEIAREKNQMAKALMLLDEVIWEAGTANRYDLTLDALGHKIIIWLHRFQFTGDESYLELMASEARAGYMIGTMKKVDKGFLAIMLHRLGHYHFYKKEFGEAASFAKASLAYISKKEAGKYAEYLGHYGLALALDGDKKGVQLLVDSLEMVRKSEDLRPFHYMIVESGVLIRIAVAAYANNDKKLFKSSLAEARIIASILDKKFKMPTRLDQVNKLEKNPKQLF
jgi:hypothetical protein